MSKILMYSDLHIHAHKKSGHRFLDCLKVQEWVFQQAIERGIRDIVFLGDLFHDRTRIEVLCYVMTYNLFEKYLTGQYPIKLYLLLGNHDLYHRERTEIFSPRMLDQFSELTIIDKPCSLNIGGNDLDFLPFTENPIDDLNMLVEANPKEKSKKRVLCSHLAIDGAQLNSFGTIADVVVEHDGEMVKIGTDKLKHWDKVWLGHYHGAQILEHGVEYLGSPLQLTKSEVNQEKHIAIFDPATLETEYIVNEFSPVHLILRPDQIDNHDLTGNFVTLTIPPSMSHAEVTDLKKIIQTDRNVGSLEIRHTKRENIEQVVQDARALFLDESKMLEAYADQTKPYGMDKEILLKVGDVILQKTNEAAK
jgi:DNA repair exonuclease SbcCD nuclease subunit